MIKFFRKIRQTLLTQNKLGKYLVYAIGEIVLVVIGILLALNINNKNEERINEEKFVKIFKEIQADLATDVQEAMQIFDFFIFGDSVQDLILTNKYTKEDYRSGRAYKLGMSYEDFVIQTNGYDNLMLNINNIPEKYQPLLKDLKYMYVSMNSTIDVYNTRIRETVYRQIDYLYGREWYQKSIKGIISEEEIDYFLNDPHYKSNVITNINDRDNLFSISQRYKERAITTYLKISELIESTEPLPEEISNTSVDSTLINEIVGTYKLKERTGRFGTDEVNFIAEENDIYFVFRDRKFKLIWHKNSIFRIDGGTIYLNFKPSKKGELFASDNLEGNATYMKIEDKP